MFSFRLLNVILCLGVSTLIYSTGCSVNSTIDQIKEPAPIEQTNTSTGTAIESSSNIDSSAVKDEPENDNKEDETNNEVHNDYLDENNVVTNPDAIDVVVNKIRNLPSDYIPNDLVKLTDVPTCLANPEVNQLRKVAAEALTKMFNDAKEENIILIGRSGYRSYNTQVSLYGSYVSNHGQEAADKFSAKPGQSEHQTGLCMDVTADSVNLQLTTSFGDTKEGKWLAENAHKYGFIIRYPEGKEDVTGYIYEPWHVRYIGEDLAKEVYESGKTLDEYMFGEKR